MPASSRHSRTRAARVSSRRETTAEGERALNCSNCGTENRPGAKFCIECGTPFGITCSTCGTVNPPGAKFCSEDATPLSNVAAPRPAFSLTRTSAAHVEPVAERRVVSILFADLVGFTTFSEGRDSEDVRETLSRYFDLARQVVGRYGGTIEKFIGDAVMAVWGAPTAQEDDAERAVRAALDLVDAIPSLGPGIQARAGVLTGEAAVTIGATNQGMVAGDLVNTASRLQAAAAPGAVLVGETTQRAAAGAIAFEPAGDQVVKGKAAPIPAWRAVRVVAERRGRGRSEAVESPFVGRDEEIRLLKDLYHATEREQKPRLVSVVGPGGIGKTRLAWEFLKYLDGIAGTAWWHEGRSPAYGDGISFWALGEMVRGRAGLVETDDEPTTRARIAATVAQHVPDPDERAWVEAALLALLGIESGIASEQLFAAWRTFFERLAATNPVVMVFEDFHHADKGQLDFIQHLMEWSRAVPIMVVTLARPELLESRPDWGAGVRSFTSIRLEPLAPAAMERLLAGLVPGLPAKAVATIVARADGIPLYAVETVRMLVAQGRLRLEEGTYAPVGELGALDELAVPETLSALIAARLDGLEPGDRSLVEDAAVLGQSFTVAGLAAVSGHDRDELEPRLRALVRRELLVLDEDPRSPERGQFAFVQALIREVAYNTLSKKDRKVRHLAAARFFESLGTDELAGGLAGHYVAAQRLAGDEAEANALGVQARLALKGAAERASALGSHEQATRFLEQALTVTTDPDERADLHMRAAQSARQGLDGDIVVAHAEAAIAEYRTTGDRPRIVAAIAQKASALTAFRSDPAASRDVMLEAWLEFQDLELTPAGVDLMVGLSRAYTGLNDTAEALTWIDRFLPIAERLRLDAASARGILRRGAIMLTAGQPRQGVILLRGAHQFALNQDLWDVELGGRTLLTFYQQWGEPAAGLALGREGLEMGRRTGSRGYQAQMIGNTVICALRVGEWEWAEALLDEWLTVDSTASVVTEFYVDRSILRSVRGADPTADIAAAERLSASFTDPQFLSYKSWAKSWAAFTAGEYAVAVVNAEAAVDATNYLDPLILPLAVRAALWAEDLALARRLVERLERTVHWGLAFDADRATARAGLAALEGRGSDALGEYRDALRVYQQLGLAFDGAVAVVDAATLLPSSERDAPDIQAAVESARAVLTRLGATPFLKRLEPAATAEGPKPTSARSPQREGEAATA
jgi:class 3 adenylate cyclase/tetratricopeptide (TPR) repeat protein